MNRCISCRKEVTSWLISMPVKCPHCYAPQIEAEPGSPLDLYNQEVKKRKANPV